VSPAGLRIGVLAGEASGDILGSRVIAALRHRYPELVVEGIGGPLLKAQGLDSLFPMERLSVMGFVEGYQLAEIVGQPTAGTNGNVIAMVLPGGFRMMWTGMKVVKHNGSQHHLIGILPTVPTERTIQGIREGRDEFLEKAIEVIKGESGRSTETVEAP
jgi:hypothetical protein